MPSTTYGHAEERPGEAGAGLEARVAADAASLRVKPAVDAGRALVVPHERPDAVAPGIAVARPRPNLALRHGGVLELAERQVFRLAVNRDVAAGAEAARHRQIGRDVGGVVPVVEFLFDHRRDVDAPHLQERRRPPGLL